MKSEQMRAAIQGVVRDAHPWWESRNVVGLCFAPKLQRGRRGEPVLQVHVRKKRALPKVPEKHRIPEFILHEGKRVWTDVHEVGEASLEMLVSSARPTAPGYDVGDDDDCEGTIGCVVQSVSTGERLGLSCAHVLVGPSGASGDRIYCPSRQSASAIGASFGSARIGTLVDYRTPSPGQASAYSNLDVATFRPGSPSDLVSEIALVGSAPQGVRADVPIGTRVKKVGASTELTFGEVQAVHWLAMLPYPLPDGTTEEVWFADQIGISRFTAPGDSGALVLDETTNAGIGLHLGSTTTLSICTPISTVLSALGVTLA